MAEVTEKIVLKALASITDPDRKQDIVSLNMVSGLTIKGGHVAFAIEVDAERGPHLEPLRKAAEDAVNALPGVLPGRNGAESVPYRRDFRAHAPHSRAHAPRGYALVGRSAAPYVNMFPPRGPGAMYSWPAS